MYHIEVETHCHTLISNHADSTLAENAAMIKHFGMKGLCITNHAPKTPDSPGEAHFISLKKFPRELDGIRLFKGVEVNLIDYEGGVDLEKPVLAMLDWVIASIHANVLPTASMEEITHAYLGVLKNPFVNCLGHIGRMDYPCDWEAVVKTAASLGKVIEVNELSLSGARVGADELCPKIAALCKKHGCLISVSSDAHAANKIGTYSRSFSMLSEIDFPKELIVNETLKKFEAYLKEAKNRI